MEQNTILRQMSDKLSAANRFSFSATREINAALAAGRSLQEKAQIEVVVCLPNAGSASPTPATRLIGQIVRSTGGPAYVTQSTKNQSPNAPNSSDGVVPYWSSHMDGATSELIVPSGHGAHQNPQAIGEVRRILILNAH